MTEQKVNQPTKPQEERAEIIEKIKQRLQGRERLLKAAQKLLDALVRDPLNVETWKKMAEVLHSNDDYEEAFYACKIALNLEPNDLLTLNRLEELFFIKIKR